MVNAQTSLRGLALAFAGVLVLTPDTLLMRLSGLDGAAMLVWRGLLSGGVFLLFWGLAARDRAGDLRRVLGGAGLAVTAAHGLNTVCFTAAIAAAPVAVVLIALATTPVWAALLSHLLIGERARPATWVATGLVLIGIVWAVAGEGGGSFGLAGVLTGGALGLAASVLMGLTFVLLRRTPELPVLLCIGGGALIGGLAGVFWTSSGELANGRLWAIALAGGVVLPLSFFALTLSTRMTHAANVSLLLLLETVLGPLWVWWGVGEAPSPGMWSGGALVVTSLAGYILWTARRPV